MSSDFLSPPSSFLLQVNFSSSLDTGSASASGLSVGGQSHLPLVALSPIIHPRIREFRSGLGSARKGGCWCRTAAFLPFPYPGNTCVLLSRCSRLSAVRPRPLQLPRCRQRQAASLRGRPPDGGSAPRCQSHVVASQKADIRLQRHPEDRSTADPDHCPEHPTAR